MDRTTPVATEPEIGFYRVRLVSRGPWVPAFIWSDAPRDEHGELDGDEVLRAELGGKMVWTSEDGTAAPPLWPWWPCDRSEYDRLTAKRDHAYRDAAWMPEAQPDRPVDIGALPPPRFDR